jgi:hypothetical protein
MIAFLESPSQAGWLIYHEPEFKGTILDYDTKQPIEGAVVVAVYKKATMGLGAGSISSIINVREALTDKEGNFRIPSYTRLIQPFSWQIPTTFIIFKPGYACLELGKFYFTAEETREQELPWLWNQEIKFKLRAHSVIELPKLNTRDERKKNIPSLPSWDSLLEKQENLIRLINEEEASLGMERSDPYKTRESILHGGRK